MPAAPSGCNRRAPTYATPTACWRASSTTVRPSIPGRGWLGCGLCRGALIIALQREDVVLPGDLALRKAVQAAYQLGHLPTQQEVLAIAEKWRPYRSLATSYLFSAALSRLRHRGLFRPRGRAVLRHDRRVVLKPWGAALRRT